MQRTPIAHYGDAGLSRASVVACGARSERRRRRLKGLTMAKHHSPSSGLLGMESDLHRVPRLLEGIGAIALAGLEAPNGVDRVDCEAIYEIVACAVESAKRTFKAWEGALERSKGSSDDVEDDPIFAVIDRHRAANAARNAIDGDVDPKADGLASIAEKEAIEDLITTAPKTILGLRAAIEYLAHYDSGCEPTASGRFIKALLKSPVLAARL
jgi:hypothetical protein